jgi:hypothetical protein
MTIKPRDQHRVSEADWLRTVGDTLDLTGWSWIHHRPARRAHGKWATPTQGNSGRGWLERLRAAGIEAHLIRLPQDWDHFTHLTAADPEQLIWTTATASDETNLP